MRDEQDKNAFLADITDEMITDLSRQSLQFFRNAGFVVKSGFIPYVRVRRPIKNIERLPYLKDYKPSTIFCPEQIITDINNKKAYKQPGFLYSPGDLENNAIFIYELEYSRVTTKAHGEIDTLTGIKLANYVTWTDHAARLTEEQIEQIRTEIRGDTVLLE